jgi:hypothetical protein
MKKNIIILSAAILMAGSCGKKLEILPTQSIEEEVVLSTDQGVKNLLNGAYDMVSSSSVYGGDLFLYSELMASDGELRWEGTFNQPREIWRKDILTTNAYVRDSWLDVYQAINAANNILGALDVVNEDDRDRVKGEALFIRGSMFFELVKFFAQPYAAGNAGSAPGIPLVLEPTRTDNVSTGRPRNTVQEVYTQVIADLTESQSLLTPVGYNDEYANAAAAAAQLSRVYLQMENYQGARDQANTAINLAEEMGFGLAGNYATLFNNSSNSSEDIFAIQVSANDGANDMHLFWSIPEFGGRDGDVAILSKHLNLYDEDDNRFNLFYEDDAETIRSGKWKFQYRNLPIIRLSELYLTRAEANFRLGTSVGATPVADITPIRTRAGLTTPGTLTLDLILSERKLELAHEGHGLHDLKRLKRSADGFAFNDPKMVLPIPQREVDAAKGILVQNEGY